MTGPGNLHRTAQRVVAALGALSTHAHTDAIAIASNAFSWKDLLLVGKSDRLGRQSGPRRLLLLTRSVNAKRVNSVSCSAGRNYETSSPVLRPLVFVVARNLSTSNGVIETFYGLNAPCCGIIFPMNHHNVACSCCLRGRCSEHSASSDILHASTRAKATL